MSTPNQQLLQRLWIDTFILEMNSKSGSKESAVESANFAVDEFTKKFNTTETDNVIGSNGLTNPPHAPKE